MCNVQKSNVLFLSTVHGVLWHAEVLCSVFMLCLPNRDADPDHPSFILILCNPCKMGKVYTIF